MIYVFPQNFNDYESEDGKIAMDKFITGIQEALPEHLRRYAAIAEVFDAADVNGKYIAYIYIKSNTILYF